MSKNALARVGGNLKIEDDIMSWARTNALARVGGDLKMKDNLEVMDEDERKGTGEGRPQYQGQPGGHV